MPRLADLGIRIGLLPSGPTASVLDVPGVGLGHATVIRDEPPPPEGRGTARTGVTVVLPAAGLFTAPVAAGGAVLNGAGECTGLLTAREWGLFETPVLLTSTTQLGRVYDAAYQLVLRESPAAAEDVVIPVVAECDDSWLNDVRRMQVTRTDVAEAWAAALASVGRGSPPAEGSVGAGTGMCCLGFKGGIGTASRVLPDGHVLGVVVLTNFGSRERLTVAGVPVGRLLPATVPGCAGGAPPGDRGSCVVVVVTDGPLDGSACTRLARRAGLGLARTGSTATHASGEIFLACATGFRADRSGRLPGGSASGADLDPYFGAVVEATEEAVLTSLLAATTVHGRAGHVAHALPDDEVARLVHRRLRRRPWRGGRLRPTAGDHVPVPPPPAGWTRFLVRSRFGAGRDFVVLDPATEQQRYFVDGKIGPRPRAEVRDASDAVVYQVRGTLLGFPKHIVISDGGGAEVASLKAKMFSPIKTRMTLEVPSGDPWKLEGSFIEKNYSITAAGRPIVQITQKWVTVRDTYTLDVADGIDPGVALAVLWAVDRWVERD